MPARKPIEVQFWGKVKKGKPNECWEWQASRKPPRGYGQIGINGKPKHAHRVAYELATGKPIPEGLRVCHHCDNPPCVNPRHLFLGSDQDNMDDAARKGRLGKLSKAAVREIKLMRGSGFALKQIAERFGVDVSMVSRIANGQRRKN